MDNMLIRDRYKIKSYNALQPSNELPKFIKTGIAGVLREVSNKRCLFMGYLLHNNNASRSWVQVFFRPSDEVVLGTTPPDLTISIGASSSIAWDFYWPMEDEQARLGTGLSLVSTTTETGTTGVTTATTGSILYKEWG